jgi:hypothetical protein
MNSPQGDRGVDGEPRHRHRDGLCPQRHAQESISWGVRVHGHALARTPWGVRVHGHALARTLWGVRRSIAL